MHLKSNSPVRLFLFAALMLAFSAVCARAVTVTYDLQFKNFFSTMGSGTMTFDDTAVPPHMLAGADGFNFTAINGTGTWGAWTSSWLDYDSTAGLFRWDLYVGGGSGSVQGSISTGLAPVNAMETVFNLIPNDLTWHREGAATPDGGNVIALLGIGLVALAGIRRRFR